MPIHASYGDNLYLVNGSPHPTLAELRSDYDGRVLPPATPLGRHDNHIDNDFVISMMNHFISELDGKEPYKTSLV